MVLAGNTRCPKWLAQSLAIRTPAVARKFSLITSFQAVRRQDDYGVDLHCTLTMAVGQGAVVGQLLFRAAEK
jgi:hypothetical protein